MWKEDLKLEKKKKKSDRLGKCESEGDTLCLVGKHPVSGALCRWGKGRHMEGGGAVRSPDVVGAGELLLG